VAYSGELAGFDKVAAPAALGGDLPDCDQEANFQSATKGFPSGRKERPSRGSAP
jgi:hypothetical protein